MLKPDAQKIKVPINNTCEHVLTHINGGNIENTKHKGNNILRPVLERQQFRCSLFMSQKALMVYAVIRHKKNRRNTPGICGTFNAPPQLGK